LGSSGTNSGTVSRQDGSYDLYITEPYSDSTQIVFSYLGYGSKKVNLSDLLASGESKIRFDLALEEAPISLETFVLKATKSRTEILGKAKFKAKRSVNFSIAKLPRQNLGAETGKIFKPKLDSFQIQEFYFFLSSNDFDTTTFRVVIYDVESNNPAGHLTHEQILYTVYDKGTGWYKIDLRPFEVYHTSDFLAALQWIDHSANGTTLTMPIKAPSFGGQHFYKYGSHGNRKSYRNMSTPLRVLIAN
jgi:hypothetical protein